MPIQEGLRTPSEDFVGLPKADLSRSQIVDREVRALEQNPTWSGRVAMYQGLRAGYPLDAQIPAFPVAEIQPSITVEEDVA